MIRISRLRVSSQTGVQGHRIHPFTRLYREILLTGDPADDQFSSKGRLLFAFIAAMFLIYAGLFIYRTSFVIDGERYFSLFDDAMISMRYAKNLANGYGLVWNPGGERVEGYTNPLWVLYM